MSDERPPQRKRLRLARHDYSLPGAYFVTICTQGRRDCLSTIRESGVKLSRMGAIVQHFWQNLPQSFGHIQLDEFIVMPDHVHGILILEPEYPDVPSNHIPGKTPLPRGFNSCPVSLLEVVRALKTESAKEINRTRGVSGAFWQRGFYDRIIRDKEELGHVRNYIRYNPVQKHADGEDLEEWIAMQERGRVAKT